MAKIIPTGFVAHPKTKAGSGAPDRLSLARDISANSHYLYAQKGINVQNGCTLWNIGPYQDSTPDADLTPFSIAFGDTFVRELASFVVPQSLSGKRNLRFVACYTGTVALCQIKVYNSIGESVKTINPSTTGEIVSVQTGERYQLVFVGTGGGSPGDVFELLSLTCWYDAAEYGSDGVQAWQPLSQVWVAADFPDTSYYLQKVIQNQANILTETSQTVFCRYFGVPWTNSGTPAVVADYRVFVEEFVPSCTLYFYARCYEENPGDTGQVDIYLDGVLVTSQVVTSGSTPNVLTGGWALYGPFTLNTTDDAINKITLEASNIDTPGEGAGVQVAGVYLWEDAPTETTLSLPGSVPANYAGNDTDAFIGFFPILAGSDTLSTPNVPAGREVWAPDAIWLKANRRRVLIEDWRHRQLFDSYLNCSSWHVNPNGVPWVDVVNFLPPWTTPANQVSNGTLLGLYVIPPSKGLTRLRVKLRVSMFINEGMVEQGVPPSGLTYSMNVFVLDVGSMATPAELADARPYALRPGRDVTNHGFAEREGGDASGAVLGAQNFITEVGPFVGDISDTVATLVYITGTKQDGDNVQDAVVLHGVQIRHDAPQGEL
jgi:hypothetical protein